MFQVRQMGTDDFSFAVQLANTMDWNMAPEDFEFAIELEPEGCLVVFDGVERVGIATCVGFGRVGWFGNLVVKEAYRRRGAGAILVKSAVDYLKSIGVETVGLYAYPHLTEFYRRFGFKADADYSVFHGKVVSLPVGERTKIQKATKQDMPDIVSFDSRSFGADRRKLLEPILRDRGNLCYMAVEAREIVGYCAATVHAEVAAVGPLVCCRNGSEASAALLKTVLNKLEKRDVFVCAPLVETMLVEALCKAGLREKFRVTRMFLGPAAARSCTYTAESLERG